MFFSPSALGGGSGCTLRLAAASSPTFSRAMRLPAGPDAAVGDLSHMTLERAALRPDLDVGLLFDQTCAAIQKTLEADPRRSHFACLETTKPPSEWSRLRAWTLERARLLQSKRTTASGPMDVRPGLPRTGPEEALQSATLRLKGTADRIRRIGPAAYEIRDYKTGATLDADGGIRAEIVLQLQAYGLMFLENAPAGSGLRLIVDDGTDREVPFGPEDRAAARATLGQIMDAMPGPGDTPAQALASPGAACWRCSFRHGCGPYLAAAPRWWKDRPDAFEGIPSDVWGQVTELRGDGPVDVVLLDDAGRRVRIRGVHDRHGLTPEAVGQRLWFFGLMASGVTQGFDGTRFHPRTFHELPRDRKEHRAWALMLFMGGPPHP
jgi:hypothetical protein